MIQPPVHYECRKWRDTDLDNCFMAFACTNDPGANRELANACAKKNILCNCAAPPDAGNCIIPARARKGLLEAAISTAGASPLLAAKLRDEMKNMLAHYAEMAKFMALLRPEILKVSQNSAENKVFFAKIASSPFSVWLAGHDYNRCREWLKKNVFVLSTTQIDNIFIKLMS